MSKKLVALLGRADWAGSCNCACRAINQTGRIECRHVSLNDHIYGYPSDIVIPICFTPNPGKATDYPEAYKAAMDVFERADLIHVWNDPYPAFDGLLPVPAEKVKSSTFTGTLYRNDHAGINRYLKERGIRLVVQNPTYRFPEEYDGEFIPHALDTEGLRPPSPLERDRRSIGCYRPQNKHNTTAHEDISLLERVIGEEHPGWHLTLDRTMPWATRMELMRKCRYFFEYMDPRMGYWGRSALEACAVGVPTFSYISEKAREMSMGRFGDPAIIHVTRGTLADALNEHLNLSDEAYLDLSRRSREWVETHYGFGVVGEHYTRFFESVLAAK